MGRDVKNPFKVSLFGWKFYSFCVFVFLGNVFFPNILGCVWDVLGACFRLVCFFFLKDVWSVLGFLLALG